MSLEMLERGKKGVIARIDGTGKSRERLLDLGLVPGVPVKKIQDDRGGLILVEALGSRVAVDRSLAARVIIS